MISKTKFWSAAAIILLISSWIMIKLGGGFSGADIPLVDSLSDSDWIRGNKEAKVVLIEYSDFQCPACAYYSKMVNDIVSEFGNHMAFAYRHFPLEKHENAKKAAYAAEAAGVQGKFWEMHDILFTYQNTWTKQVNPEDTFQKFAADLGLNMDQFDSDYNSRKIRKNVDLDIESGEKNRLDYTPTLFLNGKQIKNPKNYDEFRTLIREAIEGGQ